MRICGDRLLRVWLVRRLRLLRRLRRLRRPLEPATSGARSPTRSAKLKAALHARKTEAMPCNNDPMHWYVTLKIERDTRDIMFDPKEAESLYIVVQQMLIILVCNVLKENYVKRGQKQKQTESGQDPLQALTLTTQAFDNSEC